MNKSEILAGIYSSLYNQTITDGHIYNPRIDRRYATLQVAGSYGHGYDYEYFGCGLPDDIDVGSLKEEKKMQLLMNNVQCRAGYDMSTAMLFGYARPIEYAESLLRRSLEEYHVNSMMSCDYDLALTVTAVPGYTERRLTVADVQQHYHNAQLPDDFVQWLINKTYIKADEAWRTVTANINLHVSGGFPLTNYMWYELAVLVWASENRTFKVAGDERDLDFVDKAAWDAVSMLKRKYNLRGTIGAFRYNLEGIMRTAGTMLKMWDEDSAACTDPVLKNMYDTQREYLQTALKGVNVDKLGGSILIKGKRYNVAKSNIAFKQLIEFMAAYTRYLAVRNVVNFREHYELCDDMRIDFDAAERWLSVIKNWNDVIVNAYVMAGEVF